MVTEKAFIIEIVQEGMDYSELGYYSGHGLDVTSKLCKAKMYPTENLAKTANPFYLKKIQPDYYRNVKLTIVPVEIKLCSDIFGFPFSNTTGGGLTQCDMHEDESY